MRHPVLTLTDADRAVDAARLVWLESTSEDICGERVLQVRCEDGDPGLALAAVERAGFARPSKAFRSMRPIRLRSRREVHMLVLEWRTPIRVQALPAVLQAKLAARKDGGDGR